MIRGHILLSEVTCLCTCCKVIEISYSLLKKVFSILGVKFSYRSFNGHSGSHFAYFLKA